MIFFDYQRLSDLRLAILADLKEIIPPGYYDFVEAPYRTHYDVELTQKARKLEQNSSLSPRLSAAREVLLNHAIYMLSIQRLCTKCVAYLNHKNKTESVSSSENHQEELINDLKEEINFLWKTSETLVESVRYWVSFLSEREERIFHPDNLGYSVDNAKERIISFCGTGAKFLSDHIDVLYGKPTFRTTTKAPLNGVDKKTIALKFHDIYWSESEWNKSLASPPKWLKECRVSRGTRSKNNPSSWNPVDIAIALTDKGISTSKLDAVFVSLSAWRDEWETKSEYLR